MYSWEAIAKLLRVEHPCHLAIWPWPGMPNNGVAWKLRNILGTRSSSPTLPSGYKADLESSHCVLSGSLASKNHVCPGHTRKCGLELNSCLGMLSGAPWLLIY